MRILLNFSRLETLRIFPLCLVIAAMIFCVGSASGQFVPLPPPSPSTSSSSTEKGDLPPDDHKVPIVEVMTSSLKAGKNVFKVKLTDESGIQLGDVKYIHDGKIKVVDLVKDLNDVYKALIDIQPPSRVVVIEAGDPNGNIATVVKEFSVTPDSNIFQDIQDFFSGILSKRQ
jgi:hypothetical protein